MIEDYLRENGVEFEEIPHQRAYTAQGTAAVEHVTGYSFAKTVVVTDGEEYYLLVLPAPYRADLEKAGELIGAEVELASEEEIGDVFTGCEVGAEPPFGSLYHVKTYVDETLGEQREIVFRAGSHDATIKMNYEDYIDLEEPDTGAFATGIDA